jgi:hypothetical protein
MGYDCYRLPQNIVFISVLNNVKNKAIPVTVHGGPYGCET